MSEGETCLPCLGPRGELIGPLPRPSLPTLLRFTPFLPLGCPEDMSAIRRGDRRAARNQHSSPYNRSDAQPKKSVRRFDVLHSSPARAVGSHPCQPWSLSGFFNFLNPLSRRKPSEEPEERLPAEGAGDDETQTTDGSEFGGLRPPEILSQRGHAVRHILFLLVHLSLMRPLVILR
jgi:hypothetical protein